MFVDEEPLLSVIIVFHETSSGFLLQPLSLLFFSSCTSSPAWLQFIAAAARPPIPSLSPPLCCPVLPSLGPQRHSLLFLIKNTVPFVYTRPNRRPSFSELGHCHPKFPIDTCAPRGPATGSAGQEAESLQKCRVHTHGGFACLNSGSVFEAVHNSLFV